ncbi:aspartyl aminopeptidase [Candidatus Scalindua japonica]|uniref:Aspartyl aminopeptidase n=1 Tax=Candidatus Scalindua japonica TaxID=1284222 RepID=A0A286TTE0_9BACT|nr:hypothetical protein [Candidatus Scalindua japonica]GAX59124.1 aspartyl aminopeptidase [Candidatus Scalindua japonica]
MVFSQNPFRTSQFQTELNLHGIGANVVPQTNNVQLDANHLSSYAAVKIERTEPVVKIEQPKLPNQSCRNVLPVGMGLLPANVPGLKTYWDFNLERVKQGSSINDKVHSRFWFYPVLSSVSVREVLSPGTAESEFISSMFRDFNEKYS